MKVFITLFLFCIYTLSFAEKKIDSVIWNFALGPSLVKAEDSGKSLETFHASLGLHKTFYNSRFTVGGYAAYVSGQENQDKTVEEQIDYRTIPVLLETNYTLSTSRIQPHVNLGAGIQFSQLEYYKDEARFIEHDAGVALAAGAGLTLFLGDGFGIQANYRLLWINNQNFKNGLANMLSLGLSFRRISFFYE